MFCVGLTCTPMVLETDRCSHGVRGRQTCMVSDRHVLLWCQTDMYGVRETCAPMVSETDMYPYDVRDRHVLLQCQRHVFP